MGGFFQGLKRQLTTISLSYLGGHPDLPMKVGTIGLGKENNEICVYAGPMFKKQLGIPTSDIVSITLVKDSERSFGKAAAGAVVGGVLTGGLGALAGAAIGGRSKDTSVIKMTVKYSQTEIDIFFGGDNVQMLYPQVMGLLK